MKIALACDHGGYALKQSLLTYLSEKGYEIRDFGCYNETSIDYPDFAFPAAEAVASGEYERGIFVCTTGIGMSVCANKVRGVRCALCTTTFQASMTRQHNDTNILALGQQTVDEDLAKQIVDVWLTTEFSNGERHVRRIQKISDYEMNH